MHEQRSDLLLQLVGIGADHDDERIRTRKPRTIDGADRDSVSIPELIRRILSDQTRKRRRRHVLPRSRDPVDTRDPKLGIGCCCDIESVDPRSPEGLGRGTHHPGRECEGLPWPQRLRPLGVRVLTREVVPGRALVAAVEPVVGGDHEQHEGDADRDADGDTGQTAAARALGAGEQPAEPDRVHASTPAPEIRPSRTTTSRSA